jgi:hypothetical protein
MKSVKAALLGAVVAVAASASAAHAGYDTGTFSFSVVTGNTSGNGFSAAQGAAPFAGGTDQAAFTYTGALDFDNTQAQNSNNSGDLNSTFFGTAGNAAPSYGITDYTEVSNNFATTDFANSGTFLDSSGSAADYQYGSFYTIDLGVLAAGTVLTISHDDGASVFQGGTQIGTSTTGPTTVVTDTVDITSTADTTLYYSRQNGTPSILQVAVPEPASIALVGFGVAGLGFVRRRKNHRAG